MKRGAVKTADSEMISLWIPKSLLAAIDAAVNHEDSDRSKFIRRAIRKHVSRPPVGAQDH